MPSEASEARRLRDTLGITVHFVEPPPPQIDAISRAGFHWVRTDFSWARIETVRGRYDFSRYDQHVAGLLQAGLSSYAILDYGNPLYNDGLSPVPGTDAYSGFLRYVEALTTHYAGLVELWEIWNEPNN